MQKRSDWNGRRARALALVAAAWSCSSPESFFSGPPVVVTAGASGLGGDLGGAGGHAGGPNETGGKSTGSAGSGGSTAGITGVGGGNGGTGLSGNAGVGAMGGSGAVGGSEAGAAGDAGGEPGVGGTAGSGTAGGGTGGTGVAGGGLGGLGGTGGQACVPEAERCDGVSNDCDDAIDEDGVCPSGCTARTLDHHVYLLCLFANARDQLNYDEASAYCSTLDTDPDVGVTLALATLQSAAENDAMKAWIQSRVEDEGLAGSGGTGGRGSGGPGGPGGADPTELMVWMGANDIDMENRWVWGRGSSAVRFFVGQNSGGGMPYMDAFNDFGNGRPNSSLEDCGVFDSSLDWQWNDDECDNLRLGLLCESL